MPDFLHIKNDFLKKVIAVIEENLDDEHFGVSELAEQVSMSRSSLLRKVKQITGLSVSLLIRQVRLHHAKEMLRDSSLTVSEVSYKAGFNSTSYFIRCFREQYGYPPGEEGKRRTEEDPTAPAASENKKRFFMRFLLPIGGLALALMVFFGLQQYRAADQALEKSIAVLPFKNDSNDSANVYIINGLMEAILNNLQKIQDLRVISRTSVEKYRDQTKSIPEISKELDVNYFVEGSGQKIGDQILLTIQLIKAPRDKHLWSERYSREARDIFRLQTEVAKDIADEIEAIITPEEQQRIEKIPTENLVAYDYYLKGLDLMNKKTREGLEEAIGYFEKAVAEDEHFAHAYAYVAICYYYLDIFQTEKKYGLEINTYADQAVLLDAELPESLIAKALFYMQDSQYELAVQYLEKVLEYNPNSGWTNNFLSDLYTTYLPNTEKYLTHALQGIRLDMAGQDSGTTSFTYLHLGNALAQTGFIEEAEKYIKKSLAYDPGNLFSEYVYAYILLAKNGDFQQTRKLLIKALEKDPSRIDIIQEVAKICYIMRDYEEAVFYYDKFLEIKESLKLNVFEGENIKIGFVLEKAGRKDEAEKYFEAYRVYAENDRSLYRDLSLSAYHAVRGDIERSVEFLKRFSDQENYQYWFVLFLEKDPIIQLMAEHPDFNETIRKITTKFWDEHRQLRKVLEEEKLL